MPGFDDMQLELDWDNIETVLLDMDGTLLDRHFDDHFWLEYLPKRWAERESVEMDAAKEHLHSLYRSQERTLNWTDLDYWSDRLEMDIPQLKLELEHLIAVHPGVELFLDFCRRRGKQLCLVTNAHEKTVDIKMNKTMMAHHFDRIITAHQVGLPKENGQFWQELQRFVDYNPATTMLGEDSEANLQTAADYGIRHLFYISHYSSRCTPVSSTQFVSIDYFTRLLPSDR